METVFEIDVDQMIVRKTVCTTVNAKEYKQVWKMDLSGCDKRDLLDLASRAFVIDMQAKFRNKNFDEADRLAMGDKVLNVKELMGKGLVKKDIVSKTIEQAKAKMTPEQRRELLAQLLAMQDGED